MMKFNLGLIATVIVVGLALPSRAEAYLDPSAGSMIFQVALGGALALLAGTKMYWARITSRLRTKPKFEDAAPGATAAPEETQDR